MILDVDVNEEVLDEEEVKLSLTVEEDPEEEALDKIPTIDEILEEFKKPFPDDSIVTCTAFKNGGVFTFNYKFRTEVRKGWGNLEKYKTADHALTALYAEIKETLKVT